MIYTTNLKDILTQIDQINPINYCKTRNYIDGAITKLSPYISRGVISTKMVVERLLAKGYKPHEIEIFIKQLAWRDYFQQVGNTLKDDIVKDIKHTQENVRSLNIPKNIVIANTTIQSIDNGISELYNTGYMHNHVRMYVASLCCNFAQCHWKYPSKWMYYYLLDADWASNTLSWQWVAGSFSSKKYFANQENINKYCYSNQVNTFLDVSYEEFQNYPVPPELQELVSVNLATNLPDKTPIIINEQLPSYLYNMYNLDCMWDIDINANRILLLEPGFFIKHPVCNNTIQFIIDLSKNISDIQIYIGEFNELVSEYNLHNIHFKEHPAFDHYRGIKHKRDWIFEEVTGYYPSFFNYWKKCQKFFKRF